MDQHYLYSGFCINSQAVFFSGFVSGDDPNYADRAYTIIRGYYPSLCKTCVFAFRPILLFSTAIPLKYLGWSEFNFILPILLSSLRVFYLIKRIEGLPVYTSSTLVKA